MKIALNCFACNQSLEFTDRVGLREECLHCRADVHVCKNCQFYDAKAYNECREPSAEVVREKDRSNYCDFFVAGKAAGGQSDRQSMLSAAEALFKKKP